MTADSVIKFYRVGDPYGEFSNFAPYPITIDGVVWPTTEHYFQAMKFKDRAHQGEIRRANGPMLAARMGRDRKRPLRRDWESVKDQVMYRALQAKFTQHEELRALLLSTGEAKLIEHTRNDRYWADGGDGRGKNRLGVLLMRLRAELAGS
ncbi:MAG: NADAR family protein [Myxococcales bacterium]|nr:NADAR family protein [Myxococcales bacterium]MCB9755673.1 NADAR family protein [Myxococcales bacterium]